jgi:predicted  nucleic acid-binding Zn-ribbon protein
MSRSSDLYNLQLIDSQLDRHQRRLLEIERALADNSKIQAAEKILKVRTDELEATKKELSKAEELVQAQRLKVKQTDAQLYSGKISNPKELQDLQEEKMALKRYLSVLEDRQLEQMLEIDEKRDHFTKAQAAYDSAVENHQNLSIQLNTEKVETSSSIKELESRRDSLHNLVSNEDLSVYHQIRKQRNGVAVSRVEDRACSSCGATLTAALHQAARSPNQITRCESCGRILFS